MVLALPSDSAALFTATVVRDFAPDLPLFACVEQIDNVERAQRAGADFALSVSQVAGQILIRHVLGETVSLQPRIKLIKSEVGRLAGRTVLGSRIREKTGCSIVAIERDGELMMEISPLLELAADDAVYLCGTGDAVARFQNDFRAPRL